MIQVLISILSIARTRLKSDCYLERQSHLATNDHYWIATAWQDKDAPQEDCAVRPFDADTTIQFDRAACPQKADLSFITSYKKTQ